MAKVRIVTQNAVFGFKGQLFHRTDSLGNVLDHEVDDDLAVELTTGPNARFRVVDENGEVVKTEVDLERERMSEEERAARTVRSTTRTVSTTKELLASGTETDQPEEHVEWIDDEQPAEAQEGDAQALQTEAETDAKPKVKVLSTKAIKEASAETPAADTEGAVEA